MKKTIRPEIVEVVDREVGYDRWLVQFILGQIYVESSFDRKADSGYARGLMQVSRAALKDYNSDHPIKLSYDDMYHINHNIRVGVWYLKRLMKRYQDRFGYFGAFLALVAYNIGLGNLDRWFMQRDHTKMPNVIKSGCMYALKCMCAVARVEFNITTRDACIYV